MKLTIASVLVLFLSAGYGLAQSGETEGLKRQVEEQGKQIEELQQKLARLERALLGGVEEVRTSLEPVATVVAVDAPAFEPTPRQSLVQTQPAQAAPVSQTVAQPLPQIAGFRLSGDFRLRFDSAVRESSLQNIRQRYRLRLNIDRDIAPDLNFHMQLATGAVNNGITFDQDFAGGVTRQPAFISEAYVEYRPTTTISLRGGRTEGVFADNSRFLFDDDVRFNGFNERWKVAKNIELRAGQYFFVHPNLFSVPANSPYVLAGVEPGSIARAAQMFHQGLAIDNTLSSRWRGQFIGDIQLFRNPNLLTLTSTAAGYPVTLNPAIGLMLSGPAPGTGNATTAPNNAILAAGNYQVVRGSYKLDANSLSDKINLPVSFHLQLARNVGTSSLQDAIMSTLSIGRTQEAGEFRALYTFAIKDANSMISQLTDDDLGTTVGTNLATHHFRFDYALRRGVVFQNLIFRQTARRASNPDDSFFVPLGRGTPTTWRYQGQLAISF